MKPEGILEDAHGGMNIIIPTKESRPVKFRDLWKVLKDSTRIKLAMLTPFPGYYDEAASISHCQIEGKDPLRFFVVGKQFGWYFGNKILKLRTIINPEIIGRHGVIVKNKEGCMSFPFNKPVRIPRYEIVQMKYWTFFGPRNKRFYLFRAYIIQHELDHHNFIDITEHRLHKDRKKAYKKERIKSFKKGKLYGGKKS